MSLLKFSILLTASISAFGSTEGVSYELSGGRFGDNLLAYLHAKWIAYIEEVPLFYRRFDYSSELILDEEERPLEAGAVWEIPYFPENLWEIQHTKGPNEKSWIYFAVNWEDPEFKKIALSLIQPKSPVRLLTPPADCVSVAIHFREGGGYDTPYILKKFPLKFPPLSYYLEALDRVIECFPEEKIYCYLFTDASNAKYIANRISEHLPPHVVLECRQRGNHWKENVLEDFFSLFQFDVLIRPQSNFSLIPALLHPYALVLSPEEFSLEHRTVSITKISMEKKR